MVQIIPAAPPKRSFWGEAGSALGQGFSEKFSEAIQTGKENKALKKRGIDVEGLGPEARAQVLAHELQQGMRRGKAEATRQYTGETIPQSSAADKEKIFEGAYEKEELPKFMDKKKRPFDIRERGKRQEEPSNEPAIPERETNGKILPVKSADQMRQEAAMFVQRANEINPNMAFSDQEAYALIAADNEENIKNNELVRQEQQRERQAKEEYGMRGMAALQRYLPTASPEQMAYFQKLGENLALAGGSPADIETKLAEESKQFKQMLSRVSNGVGPTRTGSQIGKGIVGSSRTEQSKQNELKLKLKPLLDLGMADTARELLSEKGFDLEERETLVSSLPEETKKIVAQIPDIKTSAQKQSGWFPGVENIGKSDFEAHEERYSPQQKEMISNTIKDIYTKEPNTNLILLRRDLEKKNVDWEIYNDEIQKGILEGYINLNPEQLGQLDYLQEPPLDRAGKFWHFFGVRGR